MGVMKKIKYYIPAMIMLCVIFGFSAQNGNDSGHLSDSIYYFLQAHVPLPFAKDTMTFVIRKCAHMTEFGLLGLSFLYGFSHSFSQHLYKVSLALVFVCGCLDEFHQRFSAGRSPSLRDALIDTTGALIFLNITYFITHRQKRENRVLEKV